MKEANTDNSITTFTPRSFYGSSSKPRTRRHRFVGLDENGHDSKRSQKNFPADFVPRILGPTVCWKVFYRQSDAFQFANSLAQDVHVFSFEACTDPTKSGTGQRRYLASSLPVFWHYYSQLQACQRHHYEIIPEKSPCKLYFDLEFQTDSNPDRDGEGMVDTLIKFVCAWIGHVYGIDCHRTDVMDLDASTSSKFSRHLIFQDPALIFDDNVTQGDFVRYIFGFLENAIQTWNNNGDDDVSDGRNRLGRQSPCVDKCNQDSHGGTLVLQESGQSRHTLATDDRNGLGLSGDDSLHDDGDGVGDDGKHCELPQFLIATSNPLRDSGNNLGTKQQPCTNSLTLTDRCIVTKGIGDTSSSNELKGDNVHCGSSCDSKLKRCDCRTGEDNSCTPNHSHKVCHYGQCGQGESKRLDDIHLLDNFTQGELERLKVIKKDGKETWFCDLGVYTKNRNFRLFLSSKLNKNNPLKVADRNQCNPPATPGDDGTKATPDQGIFWASLITNVSLSSDTQLLRFDSATGSGIMSFPKKQRGSGIATNGNNKGFLCHEDKATLEGWGSTSPYPEIDEYISSLVAGHDGHVGAIRHWNYWRQGQIMVYDIVGYRWCHNVQRHHRSNNIMYVVDVGNGICYQKCHDPDCQTVNYRSPDIKLPSHVIPGYYLDLDDETQGCQEPQLCPQSSDSRTGDKPHPSVDGHCQEEEDMLVSAVEDVEMLQTVTDLGL